MYYVAIFTKLLTMIVPAVLAIMFVLKLKRDTVFANQLNEVASSPRFKLHFFIWLPTIALFFFLVAFVIGMATDDFIERTKPEQAVTQVCVEVVDGKCVQMSKQETQADDNTLHNAKKNLDKQLGCKMPIKPFGTECE